MLSSNIRFRGEDYLLVLQDNNYDLKWFLLNPIHKEDRVNIAKGLKPTHMRLLHESQAQDHLTEDYIIEAMKVDKKTGTIYTYGNNYNLQVIVREYDRVRTYIFPEGSFTKTTTKSEVGFDDYVKTLVNGELSKVAREIKKIQDLMLFKSVMDIDNKYKSVMENYLVEYVDSLRESGEDIPTYIDFELPRDVYKSFVANILTKYLTDLQAKGVGINDGKLTMDVDCDKYLDLEQKAKLHVIKDNSVEFSGRTSNMIYRYSRTGNILKSLFYRTSLISVDMVYHAKSANPRIKFSEIKATNKSYTQVKLNVTSKEELMQLYDLSWCLNKDGSFKKDYKSIKTNKEFEEIVINGIVEEYWRCQKSGEEFVLAIDTETTGLGIAYLSDSNPNKDYIVATPISWKKDQAVVVFNRMKHFDNVDVAYMMERLRPLVEEPKGDGVIDLTPKDLNGNSQVGLNVLSTGPVRDLNYKINRSKITLTGHNVMFDGKVFMDNGVLPYWNDDTLQMAFVANPKVGKATITTLEYDDDGLGNKVNPHPVTNIGGVGLKNLTRRFYGHETPELTELLGKGNEGCYNEITIEELALIYGCADADYSRGLRGVLKDLIGDQMYSMYQKQDIPMLNILYQSEYYGLLMDEAKVKVLGDIAVKNLAILHDFLKEYIGKYQYINNTRIILKDYLRSGKLDTLTYNKVLDLVTSSNLHLGTLNDTSLQILLAKVNREVDTKQFLLLSLAYLGGKDGYAKSKMDKVQKGILDGSYIFDYICKDAINIYCDYVSFKIDKDTFLTEKANLDKISSENLYQFEVKASDLIVVLYEILGYPIIAYTSEDPRKRKPSVDKNVMKKLMTVELKESSNQLHQDILDANGKVLIEAKKFNKLKYPIALILDKYSMINKEYTSYFKPIIDGNVEGRIFKPYSLARIETRRIMNASQTMKSELKEITLPFDGGKNFYMVDFDMAQVEYRIMVSLACAYLGRMFPQFKGRSVADLSEEEIATLTEDEQTLIHETLYMVNRLKDPEKDFHTESAAMLKGIPAHTVDRKFRKRMKSIHFGIPYGLGLKSLCESMFGKYNDKNRIETQKLYNAFANKNKMVMAMLEHHRDEALKPRKFSYKFKKFAGFVKAVQNKETGEWEEHVSPVGWVKNLLGFYRLFDLDNLTNRSKGSIRRAAGNYPIQAFAAELFRMILIRFYNRCKKEGIADKVKWHMLIHDELLMSVHKSVNPFYLYKLIYEECMVTIPGHTRYFVGINIGDNWHDCKDDANEAPVIFVQRMIKRWESGEWDGIDWFEDPKKFVLSYMHEYQKERIHEVLKELQPNIDNEPIDMSMIFKDMGNYTVRAYLPDFFKPDKFKSKKGKSQWYGFDAMGEDGDRLKLIYSMSCWSEEFYGKSKDLKAYGGNIISSSTLLIDDINVEESQEDSSNLFDLDFDSTDLDIEDLIFEEQGLDLNDEDDLELFITCADQKASGLDFKEGLASERVEFEYEVVDGNRVAKLIVDGPEFNNILELRNKIMITLPSKRSLGSVMKYLEGYKSTKGKQVLIQCGKAAPNRFGSISDNIDLKDLDNFITKEVK